MTISVHAGHNPDGKAACGAVGFLRESTEARKVKNEVISQLQGLFFPAYDCTCENGLNQSDVLKRIVNKCNARDSDLNISIHFNSGAKDYKGDRKTAGVETFVYNKSGEVYKIADNICSAISGLGFRNRGVKENKKLYFLKHTKAPSILVECCFVDDKDDAELYDYQKMANAIVYGITGKTFFPEEEVGGKPGAESESAETQIGKNNLYRVQVGAYSVYKNAENMRDKLRSEGFDAILVKA